MLKRELSKMLEKASELSEDQKYTQALKYYENNVSKTINFLKSCVETNVKNLIFSSTAAVYGASRNHPIKEGAPKNPKSPYGSSKLMVEEIIKSVFPKKIKF